ncbi:MAG: AAA family ATPase [Chloroflexaceae bacterium]|nr:AAA family ATPase [Chloroflexaceae bacterium]
MLLETVASYVPRILVRWYQDEPRLLHTPTARRLHAPILIADLSGFTHLSEVLSHRQPDGVEQLSRLLNRYFGSMIDTLLAHGGDIVEFTGDGLIALWDAHEYTPPPDLPVLLAQAAHAALALQHELAQLTAAYPIADTHLTLRVCIGVGEVLVLSVGGVLGRWELLVAGDAVQQASDAIGQAHTGEVLLSAAAWHTLGQVAHGVPTTRNRTYCLHQLRAPRLPAPAPPLPEPATLPLIRGHIPGAVLSRMQAGQTEWLAELRYLTVIFLDVQGLNYTAPDALQQVHSVMRALQIVLYQYEGSVNQFIVDDKGTVLVAALGLPPLTHRHEAVLAVQAAQAMVQRVQQLGYGSVAGLATGLVFCGSRGNHRRRDYALIGDVINLASRLMQHAQQLEPDPATPDLPAVLCDAATYQAARAQLNFARLPPVPIKGKGAPVAIFRPLGTQPPLGTPPPLIGRAAEQALLTGLFDCLLHKRTSAVLILEGEVGMGKSRLLDDLLEHARAYATITLLGAGDALAHHTPYHAWRSVFQQLFHLHLLPNDLATQQAHVLHSLAIAPELLELAPLLNTILHLDLPDTALTAHMPATVRAEQTHRILLRLLQLASTHLPMVLVLEDAHWLDSPSWSLALAATQTITPLLLIVSTQPLTEPLAREYQQLLRQPQAQRLLLAELEDEAARQLIAVQLDVAYVADEVLELVQHHARGNPFLIAELTRSLYEAGTLRCTANDCRLPANGDLPSLIRLPANVQGVIASRIDRQPPALQLTVKVASVIGVRFASTTLHAIYPLAITPTQMQDYLRQLEQAQIFRRLTRDGSEWEFVHILIREAVYATLLYAQRRDLHRAVATWHEQHPPDGQYIHAATLAHHWLHAEEPARALGYLVQAGEYALHTHAYREASRLLLHALVLVGRVPPPPTAAELAHLHHLLPEPDRPPPAELVRWQRLLAEAYLARGKLAQSREQLEQALQHTGYPPPHTKHLLALLVRCSLRPQQQPALHAEAARLYAQLSTVAFFAGRSRHAITANLAALALAEQIGISPELALARAAHAVALAALGFTRPAHITMHRAQRIATQTGDAATQATVASMAGLAATGRGAWAVAQTALHTALDQSSKLRDDRQWGQAWLLLAQCYAFQGDFRRAQSMFVVLSQASHQRGDGVQQAWAWGGQGQMALRRGDLGHAQHLLTQTNTLLDPSESPSIIGNYGLLAQTYLRLGDLAAAQHAAQHSSALLAELRAPLAYYLLEGYAGCAELALYQWQQAIQQRVIRAARERTRRAARRACTALAHYAYHFPIGKPRWRLYLGYYLLLHGWHRLAMQQWHWALHTATELGMPYEAALLHTLLARHAPQPATRQQHQHHAHIMFAQTGGDPTTAVVLG